jgi:phosphopantothenate-cysteine ligase
VLGTLLLVEFNTLSDYLFLLRTMAEALGNLGSQIMFYLAAAVSDFYIPEESMVRKSYCFFKQ